MSGIEARASVYQNPFIRAGLLASGIALTGTTLVACGGSSNQQTEPTAGPSAFPSTAVASTIPFKAPINAKPFPNCSPAVRDAALPALNREFRTYLSSYRQPDVTQADVTQQAVTAISDLNAAVNSIPSNNVFSIANGGKTYFRQLPDVAANGVDISYVVNSSTAADATSCTAYDLHVWSAGTALTLSMTGEGGYELRNEAEKPLLMANGKPLSRAAVAALNAITDLAVAELAKIAPGNS